jgi:hypothetical protein
MSVSNLLVDSEATDVLSALRRARLRAVRMICELTDEHLSRQGVFTD